MSPEMEGAFDRFARCFQAGFLVFGRSNHTCIIPHHKKLERILIAWHIRLGDLILHRSTDAYFENTLVSLMFIAKISPYWTIFLVGGGGKSTKSSLIQYRLDILSIASRLRKSHKISIKVEIPSWSLDDTFSALLQAHIVVGSGSSLVHAASLFSNFPLFLNHEPKHGFNFGSEIVSDSVDMDRNGSILDSLRRVRIQFQNKILLRHPPCKTL
jgi:hypothetical protein